MDLIDIDMDKAAKVRQKQNMWFQLDNVNIYIHPPGILSSYALQYNCELSRYLLPTEAKTTYQTNTRLIFWINVDHNFHTILYVEYNML